MPYIAGKLSDVAEVAALAGSPRLSCLGEGEGERLPETQASSSLS